MSSLDRQFYFDELWKDELKGGIVISEYSTFLAQDAEAAFVSGAFIATTIVCCCAIESHIKFEGGEGASLYRLLPSLNVSRDILDDIDSVRRFRNKWVHVKNPALDDELQKNPEAVVAECEEMAKIAVKCLIKVLCADQFV